MLVMHLFSFLRGSNPFLYTCLDRQPCYQSLSHNNLLKLIYFTALITLGWLPHRAGLHPNINTKFKLARFIMSEISESCGPSPSWLDGSALCLFMLVWVMFWFSCPVSACYSCWDLDYRRGSLPVVFVIFFSLFALPFPVDFSNGHVFSLVKATSRWT